LTFLKLDICAFTDFGCVTSNRSISLQPLENTIVEKVKRKKLEHRVTAYSYFILTSYLCFLKFMKTVSMTISYIHKLSNKHFSAFVDACHLSFVTPFTLKDIFYKNFSNDRHKASSPTWSM